MERNINEAIEAAKVNARASRLFADGYKVEVETACTAGIYYRVTNPAGEEYIVDPLINTCSCLYFTKNEGKKRCKHQIGVRQLVEDQRNAEEEEMWKEVAFLNGVEW
jgi:predicted nucleic acid-binding Zn finger protein